MAGANDLSGNGMGVKYNYDQQLLGGDPVSWLVSVKAFGARGDGYGDDTNAFNLALQAAEQFSPRLYNGVYVPPGVYKIRDTLYLRRGVMISGVATASILDMTSMNESYTTGIKLAQDSVGMLDGGGFPAAIKDLFFLGGSAQSGYAAVDTRDCAGWYISNCFFSGPGTSVIAGGNDGLIDNNIFDLGVNHVIFVGANIRHNNNLHYLGNQHLTFQTGAYNVSVEGNTHEYAQVYSVLVDTGATGVRNLMIADNNYVMNGQPATDGCIAFRGTGTRAVVQGNNFTNVAGSCVVMVDPTGVLTVRGGVMEGIRPFADYAQTSTMGGVDIFAAARAKVLGVEMRELPGVPVQFRGTGVMSALIKDNVFDTCTGGTNDVVISNTQATSKIGMFGNVSNRTLYNTQAVVPVTQSGNVTF